MKRRSFLKVAGSSLILPSALTGLTRVQRAHAQEANRHNGPFWLTIHASGGWDPTLICDPKGIANENDPAPINHYFTDEITEVGNFLVPPVAGMEAFFTQFQSELLVINGIDIGSNGHETGTRATWSGGAEANRPAFTAMVAAAALNQPGLAFISNGGYDHTQGITPITRLPNTGTMLELAYPDKVNPSYSDTKFLHDDIQAQIIEAQQMRLQRLQNGRNLPRNLNAMQVLEAVRADDSELKALVEILPTNLRTSDLEQQIQIALACFAAGVSVSASLSIGGFDTHGNHDNNHTPALQALVAAVQYAREESDRLGITDKLNIMIGSDFARTPYYNDGNGKDHWSIGSMMFLGPNINGGRVIGGTDETQLPLAVNPETMELDPDGVILTPGNIHAGLRRLAGIEEHPVVTGAEVDEWLPIFES